MRRSAPRITFSRASVKSAPSTSSWLRRAARSAASLTRFLRSAPTMPGVEEAIPPRSTSSASGTERVCTPRICLRPTWSGGLTETRRSNRPGRRSAGSSTSGRFVAPRTMTPSAPVNPSISVRIWLSVCSRSSCPPIAPPPPRALRDGRPQPAVAVGVLQEVDDLDELLLRLVDAGHVGEGRSPFGHLVPLRPRSAQPADAAGAGGGRPAYEHDEEAHEEERRPEAEDQRQPERPRLLQGLGTDDDVLADERLEEVVLGEGRAHGLEALRGLAVLARRVRELLLELALDVLPPRPDLSDVAPVDLLAEDRVRDLDPSGAVGDEEDDQPVDREEREQEPPEPPAARQAAARSCAVALLRLGPLALDPPRGRLGAAPLRPLALAFLRHHRIVAERLSRWPPRAAQSRGRRDDRPAPDY